MHYPTCNQDAGTVNFTLAGIAWFADELLVVSRIDGVVRVPSDDQEQEG